MTAAGRWGALALLSAGLIVGLWMLWSDPLEQAAEADVGVATAEDDHRLEGLGAPVGFGELTTGGDGGPTRWVDTLEDEGPGSLRAALARPGPAWVRFQPGLEGLITLTEPMVVPSDITIDGRGARITIDNYGFIVAAARNVIITHLRFDFAEHFDDYKGNAAVLVTDGGRDVWIHQNSFVGAGPDKYNQALLFIDGASGITASWNRFVEWDRTILTAQDQFNEQLSGDRITLHHNFFDRTHQRNPLMRFSRVHSFNNYLFQFGHPGSGVGMVADAGAQLVSDHDIFESDLGLYAIKAGDWFSTAEPGLVRVQGTRFIGVAPELAESRRPDSVFDPATYYDYRVDEPDDELRQRLIDGTGWQPSKPPVGSGAADG